MIENEPEGPVRRRVIGQQDHRMVKRAVTQRRIGQQQEPLQLGRRARRRSIVSHAQKLAQNLHRANHRMRIPFKKLPGQTGFRSPSRWLLLGNAVQSATLLDEVQTIDAYHLAATE